MKTELPDDRHEGDDAVDRAWRATSVEEPSPQLDAAIIAAARAEGARATHVPDPAIASRARLSGDWWTGWQPLAAAAAVAGIAFVLVQMIPRDRDVAAPVTFERTRPRTDRAPQVEPVERPPAAELAAEPDRAGDTAAAVKSTEPKIPETPPLPPAEGGQAASVSPPTEAAPSAPAPAPMEPRAEVPAAPTAPAQAADAEHTTDFEHRKPLTAKAVAPSAAAGVPEPVLAPGEWVAKIEGFLAAGDSIAAARELRAFRAAYGAGEADRSLPEALRKWASTVE